MTRFLALCLVSTFALVGAHAVVARAQSHDHLRCYRVSDRAGTDAGIEIATLPFGLSPGCKVKASARELCVPTTADVLTTGQEAASDIGGEDLQSERLCYRIKCPQRTLPQIAVADRFGARSVSLGKAARYCTTVSGTALMPLTRRTRGPYTHGSQCVYARDLRSTADTCAITHSGSESITRNIAPSGASERSEPESVSGNACTAIIVIGQRHGRSGNTQPSASELTAKIG